MLDLSVRDAARAAGGTLIHDCAKPVRSVVTDSRNVEAGSLFVALPGARTDGHRFLEQARARGAVAALVEADRGARPADLPVIVVPDTLAALGRLACFHYGRLRATVVGVTGTVGKTTAKDFLAQLLGGPEHGAVCAPASYNSECGLPLAILATPLDARRLVLEYGINAPGEMERLLRIGGPHHAWITALTEVHLEGMGDLATIVTEKLRLARGVPESGSVWMTPSVQALTLEHGARWGGRLRVAGLDAESGGRVLRARPGAWEVELPAIGRVVLPVLARHEAELACVAAGIAAELGVSAGELRERLPRLLRPRGRLTLHRLHDWTVLDDAYNASPAAMVAALDLLAGWPGVVRRVAVLGTMHEMGSAAERCHREVGRHAARLGIELLVAVGRGGVWIAEGARAAGGATRVACVPEAKRAADELQRLPSGPTVVLLKASRAEELERLVEDLGQPAADAAAASEEAAG